MVIKKKKKKKITILKQWFCSTAIIIYIIIIILKPKNLIGTNWRKVVKIGTFLNFLDTLLQTDLCENRGTW